MQKKEGRIRHFFRDVKNLIREVIWEGIIQGFFEFSLESNSSDFSIHFTPI